MSGITTTQSNLALELRDVVKEFPGSPPVVALDRVSLTLERGELAVIVGPSGSGKSTLLNVIGTLDRPTSGHVLVDGKMVGADADDRWLSTIRCRLIGFVFQQFHLLDGISALENVATGLLYAGVGTKERLDRAAHALDRVGLGHRLQHRPGTLSGGERQRVAIARAVVNEPAILLADEPTGNLDTSTSEVVMATLNDLNQDGVTVVVITHDQDLAREFPRRILVRDGRIESDSAVSTIEAVPAHRLDEPTVDEPTVAEPTIEGVAL